MNRTLRIIFASAALFVFASTPAVTTTSAQTEQETTATQGRPKPVNTSCPTHPEIKARSAGKCPKCRMAERNRRKAQEKKNRKAQEGNVGQ